MKKFEQERDKSTTSAQEGDKSSAFAQEGDKSSATEQRKDKPATVEQRRAVLNFARLLLWAASPLFILGFIYLWMDPFKVVWHYDNYYPTQTSGGIALNPGHVATQTYLQQKDTQLFNAFIFGNSRSIYYPVAQWKSSTGDPAMRPFHFDAAAESLMGLWLKVRFIDRQGSELRHALIVTDASMLGKLDCDHWHLCETPPALCSYKNYANFAWYNFRAFLNPEYFIALTDYSLFHQLRPYMLRKHLLSEDIFTYDSLSNECDFYPMEQAIDRGEYFTPERIAVFEGQQFPDSMSPRTLLEPHMVLLDSIASVFARHHTHAEIIISPLYNQIRLNPTDLEVLRNRFGAARVHDFSGPNTWNADYHNYYETSHYRPHVASALLDSIYQK